MADHNDIASEAGMNDEDEGFVARIQHVRATENLLRDVFVEYCREGAPVYMVTFLAFAAGRRTIAQSVGFRRLMADRNFMCSATLLRTQLDTALRLYAGFLYGNLEEFSQRVLDGARVSDMKSLDNKKLTDTYLVSYLEKHIEWIPRVYRATSGFIHLSSTHIFTALDPYDGGLTASIRESEPDLDIVRFYEGLEGMAACNMLISSIIQTYFTGRLSPELGGAL